MKMRGSQWLPFFVAGFMAGINDKQHRPQTQPVLFEKLNFDTAASVQRCIRYFGSKAPERMVSGSFSRP